MHMRNNYHCLDHRLSTSGSTEDDESKDILYMQAHKILVHVTPDKVVVYVAYLASATSVGKNCQAVENIIHYNQYNYMSK